MALEAEDRMSPASHGTTVSEPPGPPTAAHLLSPAAVLASRTALTSIIGYAELLIAEDDCAGPQRLRMLRAIEQNGRRLHALLNHGTADPPGHLDLLDGSDDGHAVDIAGLLDRVRLRVLRLLADLEPYVTVEVTPGLRMHRQSATGLRLVAQHLMENAIKYSWQRSPVEVRATSTGTLLSLVVSDSGVGIASHEHEKVFERFYRSAYALEQHIPGHGTGLTTVRNIVLRQGGVIDLRSAPSTGTTITVTLPLGPPITSPTLGEL